MPTQFTAVHYSVVSMANACPLKSPSSGFLSTNSLFGLKTPEKQHYCCLNNVINNTAVHVILHVPVVESLLFIVRAPCLLQA